MLEYGTRSCVSLESQRRQICAFILTFHMHCLMWTPSGISSFHNSGGTLASASCNRCNGRSDHLKWQRRVITNFNWWQSCYNFQLASGSEKSVQFQIGSKASPQLEGLASLLGLVKRCSCSFQGDDVTTASNGDSWHETLSLYQLVSWSSETFWLGHKGAVQGTSNHHETTSRTTRQDNLHINMIWCK